MTPAEAAGILMELTPEDWAELRTMFPTRAEQDAEQKRVAVHKLHCVMCGKEPSS